MSGEQTNREEAEDGAPPAKVPRKRAKLYLPPGKDAHIDSWDTLDVQLWMVQFVSPKDRTDMYLNMIKIGMTGVELVNISEGYGRNKWGEYLGFAKHVYEDILKHLAIVKSEFRQWKREIKLEPGGCFEFYA